MDIRVSQLLRDSGAGWSVLRPCKTQIPILLSLKFFKVNYKHIKEASKPSFHPIYPIPSAVGPLYGRGYLRECLGGVLRALVKC
jgi:hypothetical protein